MKSSGVFIASTGQHIGKTTTTLGLFSGMLSRFDQAGYIKPGGQEFVEIDSVTRVDKDALLFRDLFSLPDPIEYMSPVIFPRGFTKDYIDGRISLDSLKHTIRHACNRIQERVPMILAEGTGHVGVGAIADLDNAVTADLLQLPMVLVTSGGLGSAFDTLALNKYACDRLGVKIAGVILNRVLEDKREMILDYMGRALARWDVPLIGAIPYCKTLADLRMDDYVQLFKVPLLTGLSHRYRYFNHVRLVATSNEVYEQSLKPRQLTITPASRTDIIRSTLRKYDEFRKAECCIDLKPGMLLTGRFEPNDRLVNQLDQADIPMVYVPENTFDVMKRITQHTAKIRIEDTTKVRQAIDLVHSHTNIDLLLDRLNC